MVTDERTIGNENMQVRVKIEVVAEGLDGHDHAGLAGRRAEAGSDNVAQAQPCSLAEIRQGAGSAQRRLLVGSRPV